jgi:hypothetical protein
MTMMHDSDWRKVPLTERREVSAWLDGLACDRTWLRSWYAELRLIDGLSPEQAKGVLLEDDHQHRTCTKLTAAIKQASAAAGLAATNEEVLARVIANNPELVCEWGAIEERRLAEQAVDEEDAALARIMAEYPGLTPGIALAHNVIAHWVAGERDG